MSTAVRRPASDAISRHAGWIAGACVVLGILLVGSFFWFSYHP